MDHETINPSNKMHPMNTDKGKQKIFEEEVPVRGIGQASNENNKKYPILIDSPEGSEDNLLELLVEDHEKNEIENEDVEFEDDRSDEQHNKRKRKHRHTPYQIQGMEDFFLRCPQPDENQRKRLGCDLDLSPLQVKFWFQNKRTHVKSGHQRKSNSQLRDENDKLQSENLRLRRTYCLTNCCECGNRCGDAHPNLDQLWLQKAKFLQQIEYLRAMIMELKGKQGLSQVARLIENTGIPLLMARDQQDKITPNINGGSQPSRAFKEITELDKLLVIDLAKEAMEEVATMARIGEPLWIRDILNSNNYVLNEEEYFKTFPKGFPRRIIGFESEASRESAVVTMNPFKIIEIFMELGKWLSIFSSAICKASLLEKLSNGVEETYDGAMQIMSAKFRVLSPAVPARDCAFVRYCKKLNEGLWAVVDVSVDCVLTTGPTDYNCQKRPSGCIIQVMPNGSSKIIWVEHVHVNDRIVHSISRPIISSVEAYGARRWISILGRQCERLEKAMGIMNPPHRVEVHACPEGKNNFITLAERMVLTFYAGITTSTSVYQWTIISGNGVDDTRIMTRKSIHDPGSPHGLILCASYCFWIPVIPIIVFDYLSQERTRVQWDILSYQGSVKKVAHIANGLEPGNFISLLELTNHYEDPQKMLLIQESCSEPTTSFVVYAPMDLYSARKLIKGGNPENVQLLPSGFTIIPSGPPRSIRGAIQNPNIKGTLISMSLQTLMDLESSKKIPLSSIAAACNVIDFTTYMIKHAFGLEA